MKQVQCLSALPENSGLGVCRRAQVLFRAALVVMRGVLWRRGASSLPADPYVKVWLMHKDKRVEKKKTVVMKRCLNPVFNESFPFDVPAHVLRETTIIITVMDKDKLSRNDVIGKVSPPFSSSLPRRFLPLSNLTLWHRPPPPPLPTQVIAEPVSTDPCWSSHLRGPQTGNVYVLLKMHFRSCMSHESARRAGRCVRSSLTHNRRVDGAVQPINSNNDVSFGLKEAANVSSFTERAAFELNLSSRCCILHPYIYIYYLPTCCTSVITGFLL